MRLFRDVDDAPLPARAVPSLEICIREPLTGRVIAELVLRLSETSDRLSNMLPAANTVQRADSVPTPHESTVAGRIISSRAPFPKRLDAWREPARSTQRSRRRSRCTDPTRRGSSERLAGPALRTSRLIASRRGWGRTTSGRAQPTTGICRCSSRSRPFLRRADGCRRIRCSRYTDPGRR